MYKLRTVVVASSLVVALFAGSGVASAGVAWCDVGCPPPIEAGKVENPLNNPNGMPTPEYNGQFTLPPGMKQ